MASLINTKAGVFTVTEVAWDGESALLVHGEPTDAECSAVIEAYLAEGNPVSFVEPHTRWRFVPDSTGEYDTKLIPGEGRGSFAARLIA